MGTCGCSAPALLVSMGGNSGREPHNPLLPAHIKGAPFLSQCVGHRSRDGHISVKLWCNASFRHSEPPPCLSNGHIPQLLDRYVEQVRELRLLGVIVGPVEDPQCYATAHLTEGRNAPCTLHERSAIEQHPTDRLRDAPGCEIESLLRRLPRQKDE